MATPARAVMNRGLLQQVATPSDLYEFPSSRFVADFIGSVNLFEGGPGGGRSTTPRWSAAPNFPAPSSSTTASPAPTRPPVWVALRPEKIELHKAREGRAPPDLEDAPADHNLAAGIIRQISYLGSESVYEVELGGRSPRCASCAPTSPRRDQEDFHLGRAGMARLARLFSGDPAFIKLRSGCMAAYCDHRNRFTVESRARRPS